MQAQTLLDSLGIADPALIAIVGAGGKTSTMAALALELRGDGRPVLVTTTTKIRPPQGLPLVLRSQSTDIESEVRTAIGVAGEAVLAERMDETGKLIGIEPASLCSLSRRLAGVVVVCEADGAAGRPLKAHASHEPVVPACSTHVIVVAGIDALGRPVQDAVHRPEVFSDMFGVDPNTTVQPCHVALALRAAAAHAPEGSRVVFALNKADSLEREGLAALVAENLRDRLPGARVLITRQGTPVLSPTHVEW